ncbi:MAG: signal peptide peptidase SppA [Alphaproteobacteria bacterium]|nr:signal peptide peptidase SppA [Alphaproteobacteria bacterium]
MSLDVETLLDRRRLRQKVTVWRVLAVVAAVIAVGFLLTAGGGNSGWFAEKQIARVSITGTITESRKQLKMLESIEQAEHVEAVLVYINSPGGTTTGGEALYEGLRRIAKNKPVVAQFGTVAASAGYIVGLATDHIVARGNSITGSVGVIVQWPELSGLLEKIGVDMKTVKSGTLKAEPNPLTTAGPEALEVTAEMVADGFAWFQGLVETRRGIKVDDVPGLKKGRIFSGRQAKKFNLVDEIGGEKEAVSWLEKERGVTADLKIVDWQPAVPNQWGLSAMASRTAHSLVAGARDGISKALTSGGTISTLSLDGLASVWHPREN